MQMDPAATPAIAMMAVSSEEESLEAAGGTYAVVVTAGGAKVVEVIDSVVVVVGHSVGPASRLISPGPLQSTDLVSLKTQIAPHWLTIVVSS